MTSFLPGDWLQPRGRSILVEYLQELPTHIPLEAVQMGRAAEWWEERYGRKLSPVKAVAMTDRGGMIIETVPNSGYRYPYYFVPRISMRYFKLVREGAAT